MLGDSRVEKKEEGKNKEENLRCYSCSSIIGRKPKNLRVYSLCSSRGRVCPPLRISEVSLAYLRERRNRNGRG